MFTPEEYNSLGVEEEVLAGDFVRSGHSYYQPDNQRLLKVTQKMSYIDFKVGGERWTTGIMSEDLKQQLWQEAWENACRCEGDLSVLWHRYWRVGALQAGSGATRAGFLVQITI